MIDSVHRDHGEIILCAVQAGSFMFDLPKTLDHFAQLLIDARKQIDEKYGPRFPVVVVFPEAFLGGYPRGLGVSMGSRKIPTSAQRKRSIADHPFAIVWRRRRIAHRGRASTFSAISLQRRARLRYTRTDHVQDQRSRRSGPCHVRRRRD